MVEDVFELEALFDEEQGELERDKENIIRGTQDGGLERNTIIIEIKQQNGNGMLQHGMLDTHALHTALAAPFTHVMEIEKEAADALERYGFTKFVPAQEHAHPSTVISMDEFREHPERYMHKLGKGFLQFPVGLNFNGVNDLLNQFGKIELSSETFYGNNGHISFTLASLLEYEPWGMRANEVLIKMCDLAELRRTNCDTWIYMDTLDFLVNCDALVRFIEELPENRRIKERAVQALQATKFIYHTALEIIATTSIRDTAELLQRQPENSSLAEEHMVPTKADSTAWKQQIRASLLSQPKGTSSNEIQKLLPIRSRERFRKLAAERTAELLPDGMYAGKSLENLSVGESMVFACYFASRMIQGYETLEDAVDAVLTGKQKEEIHGKCTDFTGLALHYLREYLVPLNPEKFQGWHFGYENDIIGDYKHCYMKAVQVKPDRVDVYFIDPTPLAEQGLNGLRTPEKVAKLMGTKNHPVLLQRDAEDLLQKPVTSW